MKKLILIFLVALTGCVFDPYTDEKQICEAKPTWVDYAQCLNRIGREYYGNDSSEHTMIAYRSLLIDQVQAKKISPAEAEYLRQQKWQQVKQGIYTPIPRNITRSAHEELIPMPKLEGPTVPLPKFESPAITQCRPNLLSGGVDCTTYR